MAVVVAHAVVAVFLCVLVLTCCSLKFLAGATFIVAPVLVLIVS